MYKELPQKSKRSRNRRPLLKDGAVPASFKNITVLLKWPLVVYCLDYRLKLYNGINRLEEQMGNLATEQQQALECV